MIKKCTFALALLILCLTQFSFAGEWHVIKSNFLVTKLIFTDSATGCCVHYNIHFPEPFQTGKDDIYRTSNGGRNWGVVLSNSEWSWTYVHNLVFRNGIWAVSSNDFPYDGIGYPPSVNASFDGCNNWSTLASDGLHERFFVIDVVDSNHIWAFHDYFCKYNWDSARWDSIGLSAEWNGEASLDMFDTTYGVLYYNDYGSIGNGHVLRTMDGGYNWDTLSHIDSIRILKCSTPNKVWALCRDKLKYSSDSGYTWQTNDPDSNLPKSCFSSFDSMNLWVGCANGVILHTPDGGQSWERDSVGTSANVVSIFALSNNYVWVSTADSTLWGLGVTGVSGQHDPDIQVSTIRLKAYPNPSNNLITIQYSVIKPGQGSVSVYDITGRLVKTLASGLQTTGGHSINWNWRNEGRAVSSGVYFIKSTMTGNSSVEKIVLVR